jgi:hypothetical protein
MVQSIKDGFKKITSLLGKSKMLPVGWIKSQAKVRELNFNQKEKSAPLTEQTN